MKVTKQDALPIMPRVIRVAAYARVSDGSDVMLHSLSAQISHYNSYIQKQAGWTFAGVYADEAKTGTKENRPEFQRLLADCRVGKIDMVITKTVTRFARNTVTTLAVVRELKQMGVDVFFERENIHTMIEDSEFVLSLLAAYAQGESYSISENIKWRIRKSFAEGSYTAKQVFGYRLIDRRLHIHPGEAEVVKQVFADYLGGMGAAAIARKLCHAKIPSSVRGVYWNQSTISVLIRNEVYIGVTVLQKYFISDHINKRKCINRGELPKYRIEDTHEPIIDKATFDVMQAEIKRRYVACKSNQQKHSFTGLIKCGQCNRAYIRKRNRIGTKYEKVYWACWVCMSLGKSVCNSGLVPDDILRLKGAEILGIPAFDEAMLRDKIKTVIVSGARQLSFVFKNGETITTAWEYARSRKSRKGDGQNEKS